MTDPKNIGSGNFKLLMNGLHDMGFEAINALQLADFSTTIPRYRRAPSF